MEGEFKKFRLNSNTLSDKQQFNDLDLNEKDLRAIQTVCLESNISIAALINLILRHKNGNVIKEENREELLIRGLIKENDDVSEAGEIYIESDEVKERLKKILEDDQQ